jgi:hypothetical protein
MNGVQSSTNMMLAVSLTYTNSKLDTNSLENALKFKKFREAIQTDQTMD